MTTPTASEMKDEASSLGEKAADFAKEKVIQPATRAFRDAREHLEEGMEEARDVFVHQRDRAAEWISANPLLAVGIAAGAGALIATMFRINH